MDAPTFPQNKNFLDRQTDILMRCHLLGTSFVLKYSKIPNKTLKVPNNANGMNSSFWYLLFLVPNKCPLICLDGQIRANRNAPLS